MFKMFSCALRTITGGLRVITGLGVLAALAPVAYAIGPSGTIGPTGQIGPSGADQRAGAAASSTPVPAAAPSAAPQAAGTQGGGNRIEVTGNTASNVRCADGGSAAVNSVDVQGAKLNGRTVIVQDRNVQNVDCPPAKEGGANAGGKAPPPSQVNSIKIR